MKQIKRNRKKVGENNLKLLSIRIILSVLLCLLAAPYTFGGTVNYTYDKAGRLVSVDYSNGNFRDYRYDNAGNLLSRTTGIAMPGNVYPDESVSLKDAIFALQTASSLHPSGISVRGDINGDKRIGIAEAIYILQVISGIKQI